MLYWGDMSWIVNMIHFDINRKRKHSSLLVQEFSYKIKIISKRVGDARRLRGFED